MYLRYSFSASPFPIVIPYPLHLSSSSLKSVKGRKGRLHFEKNALRRWMVNIERVQEWEIVKDTAKGKKDG